MEKDWKSDLKHIVNSHQEAELKFAQGLKQAEEKAREFHNRVVAVVFSAVRDEWTKLGYLHNADVKLSSKIGGKSTLSIKENEKLILVFGITLRLTSTGARLIADATDFVKGSNFEQIIRLDSDQMDDWDGESLTALIVDKIKNSLQKQLVEPS